MVAVLYPSQHKAFLGSIIFDSNGVAFFTDNEEGIKSAKLYNLRYVVIPEQEQE